MTRRALVLAAILSTLALGGVRAAGTAGATADERTPGRFRVGLTTTKGAIVID